MPHFEDEDFLWAVDISVGADDEIMMDPHRLASEWGIREGKHPRVTKMLISGDIAADTGLYLVFNGDTKNNDLPDATTTLERGPRANIGAASKRVQGANRDVLDLKWDDTSPQFPFMLEITKHISRGIYWKSTITDAVLHFIYDIADGPMDFGIANEWAQAPQAAFLRTQGNPFWSRNLIPGEELFQPAFPGFDDK